MPISREEFLRLRENDPVELLNRYFRHIETDITIIRNWSAEVVGAYSPKIDIAIGPFSIHPEQKLIYEYDDLVKKSSILINSLIDSFRNNYSRYSWIRLGRLPQNINDFLTPQASNPNSRCFLAIEIEGKTSMKHRLGSIINASALGRIGIIVAKNEEVLKSILRLLAYLHFLKEVRKLTFDINNIIVIREDQFINILKRLITSLGT